MNKIYILQIDHSGKTKCTICTEIERSVQQTKIIYTRSKEELIDFPVRCFIVMLNSFRHLCIIFVEAGLFVLNTAVRIIWTEIL